MSYQAVVRNSNNALVLSSVVGIQVSILQGSVSGTAVYVETQMPSTNANGLVSIEIGEGTIVSGAFSAIDWSNGPYFIKTETDPTGGSNYTITGVSQLLSVPYALHAKTAETVMNMGPGGFTHYIGEQYGGGVIFHLWKDANGVEHGLIVALANIPTAQVWSNVANTAIGSAAQSRWNGLSNSTAIVSQAGHTNSAAQACLDLEINGYNDWYLPAIDELSLLWQNCFNVNKTLTSIGFVIQMSNYYLSSTEFNGIRAWGFSFGAAGANSGTEKSSPTSVRPIRAF